MLGLKLFWRKKIDRKWKSEFMERNEEGKSEQNELLAVVQKINIFFNSNVREKISHQSRGSEEFVRY